MNTITAAAAGVGATITGAVAMTMGMFDEPASLTAATVTACGVLAGAVGFLYRRIEKRLTDCEGDRSQLWDRLYQLQMRVDRSNDERTTDETGE